ncbi:MAG: hypothetical protein AB7R90_03000 [Reyranellaceae bacterium]
MNAVPRPAPGLRRERAALGGDIPNPIASACHRQAEIAPFSMPQTAGAGASRYRLRLAHFDAARAAVAGR